MVERSQAEIEADEVMEEIEIAYQDRALPLLNHLYAMHKLRDRELHHEIRQEFMGVEARVRLMYMQTY